MSRFLFALVFALALPALLPAGVGVSPTDNDAGSGGDAGDFQQLALPVSADEWSGRAQGATDEDWYALTFDEGTLVRVFFTASNPGANLQIREPPTDTDTTLQSAGARAGESTHFAASPGGPWLFSVSGPSFAPAFSYTIRVERHAPATRLVLGGTAWRGVELHQTGGLGFARVTMRLPEDGGAGAMIASFAQQGSIPLADNGKWGAIVPGNGGDLRVFGTSAALPRARYGGEVNVIDDLSDGDGLVRLAGVVSDPRGEVIITVFTERAVVWATSAGSDLAVWRPDAPQDARLPAANLNMPVAAATVPIKHETLGALVSWGGNSPTAQSPSGVSYRASSLAAFFPFFVVFDGAEEPGSWTLHRPAGEQDWDPDAPTYFAADVPRLGIADIDPFAAPWGGT